MLDLEPLPKRMFSPDSGKAKKALSENWRNLILYLAPHKFAGVGNLCPNASPACIAACLGLYSGQASMCKSDALEHANNVRKSRILKAQHFMRNRAAFMAEVIRDIARNYKSATRDGQRVCVRLNGSSDIAFEGLAVTVDADLSAYLAACGITCEAGQYKNIFAVFPAIQFVDYTKVSRRMLRDLPPNYHLTFSRSETNEHAVIDVLERGQNVAAVFATMPETWRGYRVISGDNNDLRHLDPRANRGAFEAGFVIGLLPKGGKAKRDASGFVIRNAT